MGLQSRDYIRDVERPLEAVGDVGNLPGSTQPERETGNKTVVDQWIAACSEKDKRIKELEQQLDEAKATQIKDLKSQIKAKDQRISVLNMANITRPETDKISTLVAGIMTGLRYIQFVSDEHDLNRQTFCGLLRLCQLILRECGADADMQLSPEQMQEILLNYYATLPQRDIDALKDHGQFYKANPGPYGAGFKFITA